MEGPHPPLCPLQEEENGGRGGGGGGKEWWGPVLGLGLWPVLQLLFLPSLPKVSQNFAVHLYPPNCRSSLCFSLCPLWISSLSLS